MSGPGAANRHRLPDERVGLTDKLSHTRFEPSGWTGNEELGYAKSIMDYLFRWMELRFLSGKQLPLFTQ